MKPAYLDFLRPTLYADLDNILRLAFPLNSGCSVRDSVVRIWRPIQGFCERILTKLGVRGLLIIYEIEQAVDKLFKRITVTDELVDVVWTRRTIA